MHTKHLIILKRVSQVQLHTKPQLLDDALTQYVESMRQRAKVVGKIVTDRLDLQSVNEEPR